MRAHQREWRVGDRFKLLDSADELARAFGRLSSTKGGDLKVTPGWTGTILSVERGSPSAAARFDSNRYRGAGYHARHEYYRDDGDDGGGGEPWTTIPLAAAMKLVPEDEVECAADERLVQHMVARASEDELPVMVLDTALPGQRIALTLYRRENHQVIRRAMDMSSRSFAMLGVHSRGSLHRSPTRTPASSDEPSGSAGSGSGCITDLDPPGSQHGDSARAAAPMRTGVEAAIESVRVVEEGKALRVEIKARRQFELPEGGNHPWFGFTWKEGRRGCRMARVCWCEDAVTGEDYGHAEREPEAPRAAATAAQLPTLVKIWTSLVVDGGHERYQCQLTDVVDALGPMPDAEGDPGALAMWIGALINPHPSLGAEPIAFDVRPALLKAVTADQRIKIATMGIRASIERMTPQEQ